MKILSLGIISSLILCHFFTNSIPDLLLLTQCICSVTKSFFCVCTAWRMIFVRSVLILSPSLYLTITVLKWRGLRVSKFSLAVPEPHLLRSTCSLTCLYLRASARSERMRPTKQLWLILFAGGLERELVFFWKWALAWSSTPASQMPIRVDIWNNALDRQKSHLPRGTSISSFFQRTDGCGSPCTWQRNSTASSSRTTWLMGRRRNVGLSERHADEKAHEGRRDLIRLLWLSIESPKQLSRRFVLLCKSMIRFFVSSPGMFYD